MDATLACLALLHFKRITRNEPHLFLLLKLPARFQRRLLIGTGGGGGLCARWEGVEGGCGSACDGGRTRRGSARLIEGTCDSVRKRGGPCGSLCAIEGTCVSVQGQGCLWLRAEQRADVSLSAVL